ncbi:hypothetical protein [Streptomyces sp. E-08]|uniref:hypothetical protein n=1 Tax=Streptomyces sp. E-08 TaxID=3404047 RepID=UPI003CFB3BF3
MTASESCGANQCARPAPAALTAQARKAVGRTVAVGRRSIAPRPPRAKNWSAMRTPPSGGTQDHEPVQEVVPHPGERGDRADDTEDDRHQPHRPAGQVRPAQGAVVEGVTAHGAEVDEDEDRREDVQERRSLPGEDRQEVAARGRRCGDRARGDHQTTRDLCDHAGHGEGADSGGDGLPAVPRPAGEVTVIVPESANVAMIMEIAAPKASVVSPPTPWYEKTAPRSWRGTDDGRPAARQRQGRLPGAGRSGP